MESITEKDKEKSKKELNNISSDIDKTIKNYKKLYDVDFDLNYEYNLKLLDYQLKNNFIFNCVKSNAKNKISKNNNNDINNPSFKNMFYNCNDNYDIIYRQIENKISLMKL